MLRRVLVVDDSAHIRALINYQMANYANLESCGEAVDGAEGVAMAERHGPDVIILDQEMPVLDGLGALTQLRAALPAATIVMFSSAEDGTVRERALGLGVDAFFFKAPEMVAQVLSYVAG